ncbi:hypothetical protein [Mesorhizobium sp.]|uniref:hypothetical protein n=1 Tax=Mesorhizobium sp. TaxID=1871066 RepID=UPI0025B9CFD5|nr:hypothetical protein [Mesorhizobium sp.]
MHRLIRVIRLPGGTGVEFNVAIVGYGPDRNGRQGLYNLMWRPGRVMVWRG